MPKSKTKMKSKGRAIRRAFDREALRRICEMEESDFAVAYNMVTVEVDQKPPYDFYHFLDKGSRVLAVAHLDTVSAPEQRRCQFLDTEGGEVVYSRALDDRLGVYIILELLPKLGIEYDVLLATGEESGQSTAWYFNTPEGKEYDWIIEFDRGGTDVVMYQYEDTETRELVRATGARVGIGIFSDVCFMEHLNTKCFNWGVGYQDAHDPRAHAYLDDTFEMVARYMTFHGQNEGCRMEHEEAPASRYGHFGNYSYQSWAWEDDDIIDGKVILTNPLSTTIMERYEAQKITEADLYECDGCLDVHSVMELRAFMVVGTAGEKTVLCEKCIPWCREEDWISAGAKGWTPTHSDLRGKERVALHSTERKEEW